jgi:hypothetical protein
LIDLSGYYNATLTENWHPGAGSSDLAELPRGVQKLAGVDFDLRGLIQLGSSSRGGVPYPKEMSGIPMKRACRRLHFVHSAIMAYDVQADGSVTNGREFFNAEAVKKPELKGGCDGMKVDATGNVFSTGPGGVPR